MQAGHYECFLNRFAAQKDSWSCHDDRVLDSHVKRHCQAASRGPQGILIRW